jgi:hypothetical protein
MGNTSLFELKLQFDLIDFFGSVFIVIVELIVVVIVELIIIVIVELIVIVIVELIVIVIVELIIVELIIVELIIVELLSSRVACCSQFYDFVSFEFKFFCCVACSRKHIFEYSTGNRYRRSRWRKQFSFLAFSNCCSSFPAK